jgi:hypothetical protein
MNEYATATRCYIMQGKLNKLLAVLLLFLTGLAARANASEFLLFYANDVHGETEPCG